MAVRPFCQRLQVGTAVPLAADGGGLVPLTDWELWACANRLVQQHGRGAISHAGGRILDLAAAGDQEGHATWLAILDRIRKLLDDKPAPGERVQ